MLKQALGKSLRNSLLQRLMVRSQCYGTASNFRAVIFDMGGVVLPSPFPMTIEYEAEKKIPAGTIWEAIRVYGSKGAWPKLEIGEIDADQFGVIFSEECSKIANEPIDVNDFLPYLEEGMGKPINEVLEAVDCLKQQGFKTALLTNNWKKGDGSTLLPFDTTNFDVIVESAVEGINKPGTPIYQLCLNRLGVAPHEAIFLDDMNPNLQTAKAVGISSIKVEDVFVALNELEEQLQVKLTPQRKGTIGVRQDMKFDVTSLTTYVNEQLKMGMSNEPEVFQFAHGQSNPTYLVDFGPHQANMVLRKKPPGKLLPSAHAVEREYRVMKALSSHGEVKTPRLIALCEDSSVIGTPFYLAEQVCGNVYKNPALPGMSRETRTKVYNEMIDTLCSIHRVCPQEAGLGDYGKPGNFMERQVRTWSRQYRSSQTHTIKYMDLLMDWLPKHTAASGNQKLTVVHGDYRLDNLIYSSTGEVLSVLDWELSTLGDPLSDLAYCCMPHYMPRNFPLLPGLKEVNIEELGIPPPEQLVKRYCEQMGLVNGLDNFDLYMAFTFFKVAAIMQGVHKRSLTGQASSAKAAGVARTITESMAELGWSFASKEGFRIFNQSLGGGSVNLDQPKRTYTTSSATHLPATDAGETKMSIPFHPSALGSRARRLHDHVSSFVRDEIVVREGEWSRHYNSDLRWTPHPHVEPLKEKARSAGLWNLFLPLHTDPEGRYGAGLTNLEYAFMCEQMGRCVYAPEIFNCSAPDTGNMEVLVMFGTDEQKSQWLDPLLSGEIRSCFAMTEPQVASSDARNIESRIDIGGDEMVVSGRKWWTSGALHPNCKFAIFMGKNDPKAPSHQQQSMVIVPMDAEGVTIQRHLTVYGIDDAPQGHAEMIFDSVKVPRGNLIDLPGAGFKIAQARLGPGRIHHCMRLIGSAERCLDLMKTRIKERTTFGKRLVERDTIMRDVALSRIEIDQIRLLVLRTAHMMDVVGNKAAAKEIAMIKVAVPRTVQGIIDRCAQAHGAAGLCADFPMSTMYGWARALRLADGPDEVHERSIARMELK